ncbi:MAG: glycosyltransferase involved in cell wall biosynthesis [Planctomycetota bacterium]|jgi:glycosyltransferase involved in cell wall biosynthesis
MKLIVVQTLPALNSGGVERGTIEVAGELVKRGHRAIVISAGGQLVDELTGVGGEHIDLGIGKKSLSSLLLIRKLRKIIQASGANILHSRSRLPAWISYLAWRAMDKDTRPAFVTSVHGPYSVNRYSKIMTRGEGVIAISDFIHRYIGDNYPDVDLSKISVIPRGINPVKYPYGYKPSPEWLNSWQREQPQLNNRFIITLPARITRWKGQQDFISVIADLKKANINIHGIIVGGAEPRRKAYYNELKTLAAFLGIDKDITFVGHRNDLKEIMSISNLVMSLSREPEAFGRTSLEALGLGIPVIAYDHGGASEVLNKLFPQGLVPALDPFAAAKRALEFHSAPPLVPDSNPFTLANMLDSTLNLYQELASR